MKVLSSSGSLTVGSTRAPIQAMASPLAWPVLWCPPPSAPAPVNLGVRPLFGATYKANQIKKLLLVATIFASSVCHAETYEDAEKKSEGASSSPAVSVWYQTKMQPAFRGVVGQAMGQCLNDPSIERPPRVDLVFVVTMSGKVGALYWKEQTPFAFCLEASIQSATFPPPLEADFYFGVGFRIPPKKS